MSKDSKKIPANSAYFTVEEIAAKLNFSPDAIWKFIRNGELRAYRFGRALRIHKTDFERWEKKSLIKFRGRPLKDYSEELPKGVTIQ